MKLKNQKGFTIIELLVVIAIIGLLASVVLVGLGGARRSGRDARRVADLRQIQVGLESYFAKNGNYPQPPLSTNLVNAGVGVSVVPVDPSGTTAVPVPYSYGVNANPATTYTLGASLEDTTNQALNNDIDGTSNGVACADGPAPAAFVYCVSL